MDDNERAEKLSMEKEVVYYETFLKAWVDNRMETDKQLLTLSSLAIGLLMIFQDKLRTVSEFVLWLSAGGMFILTIFLILLIFRSNSSYIERLICEDNLPQQNIVERHLRHMTVLAFITFMLGIILTLTLAIVKSDFVIMKVQGG
ncbi:MAG: hypothetical protein P4N59_05615 [Negativicutes bacterium]|nr:hypothetical protein [Negativicutes bacterium]